MLGIGCDSHRGVDFCDAGMSQCTSVEVTARRPRSTVTVTRPINTTTIVEPGGGGGGGGGAAQSYTHTQSSPSATWIVNHNLSYNPAVSIVSSTGDIVHGDVTYSGPQQITISFSAPFSGSVYLS